MIDFLARAIGYTFLISFALILIGVMVFAGVAICYNNLDRAKRGAAFLRWYREHKEEL